MALDPSRLRSGARGGMRSFYESFSSRLDFIPFWRKPRQRGLAIYGFFHAENGLGKAARSLATAFETTGLPTSSHNLKSGHTQNEIAFPCSAHIKNRLDAALLAINANAILPENLQGLLDPSNLRNNRRIGLFFWSCPFSRGYGREPSTLWKRFGFQPILSQRP